MHSEENRILVLITALLAGIIPKSALAEEPKFNYVDAFAKSILFYEATGAGLTQGTTG